MNRRIYKKKIKQKLIDKLKNINKYYKIISDYKMKYLYKDVVFINFKLDILPEWEFCIEYDISENKFYIFGDNKYMIDKFTWSRVKLCTHNENDFIKNINKIVNNHPDWTEYLNTIDKVKRYQYIKSEILYNIHKIFVNEIDKFNKIYKNLIELYLIEKYRSCVYNRFFELEIYSDDNKIPDYLLYDILYMFSYKILKKWENIVSQILDKYNLPDYDKYIYGSFSVYTKYYIDWIGIELSTLFNDILKNKYLKDH